jgi:hypothetical protein
MFVNNLLVPAGLATGGFLGPICPPPGAPGGPGGPGGAPNPDDLKKSPTSPEGAAAKIKQDEMQAKAKIAALEFLATVDCRYYPEAEAGLIAGLRAEKNECVRLAAAKALASGCCCSSKVIKALMTTVNCSNKDGFPAEASELVRTYAYVALERCLRKCVEEEPELPPEPPPAAKKAMYESISPIGQTLDYSAHILLANYYSLQASETPAQIIAEARQTLSRGLHLSPQTVARLSGPKNVRDALFPDSRPILSLASFNMPSFASVRMPSFARPTPRPPEPQPDQRPAVMPTTLNSLANPTPMPAPAQRVNTAAGPTLVPQVPAPTPRTGRGNLLHIFQDAYKR